MQQSITITMFYCYYAIIVIGVREFIKKGASTKRAVQCDASSCGGGIQRSLKQTSPAHTPSLHPLSSLYTLRLVTEPPLQDAGDRKGRKGEGLSELIIPRSLNSG